MTDICGGQLDYGVHGPINLHYLDAARSGKRGGPWA